MEAIMQTKVTVPSAPTGARRANHYLDLVTPRPMLGSALGYIGQTPKLRQHV